MPGLLETDAISAQNITSSLLVASYTATAAGPMAAQLRLNSLNGAAAVITTRLVLNDGSNDHPSHRASDLKNADADTRFARDMSPVWMDSGDVLKVYVESSNASDTSVSGSVRFIDAGNPATVDLSAIKSQTDLIVDLSVSGEVDDASATTTSFIGAAGLSSTDDFYNGALLAFTSGALAGLVRPVTDYVGSTRTLTVAPAFPAAPADNATFRIIGRS